MQNNKKVINILPTVPTFLALFILPIILSVYFYFSHYFERFVSQQRISYIDVQDNLLGRLLIDQRWTEWFNRFMDFALWGALAAIVLLIIWAFSSTKISFKNHYAQERFVNFNTDKNSWHTHFVVTIAIKVLLVVVTLFSFFSLLGQRIPALATSIAPLTKSFSWSDVLAVAYAFLAIIVLQLGIVIAVKLFKATQIE